MKTKWKLALVIGSLVMVCAVLSPPHRVHATSLVPSIKLYQTTIGASTTQVSTVDVYCKQVFFQNNAAGTMRIGDSTTSSTKGVYLSAGPGGGSWTVTSIYGSTLDLADYYVNGTNTQLLDIACVTQ